MSRVEANVFGVNLPSISSRAVAVKLLWGSVFRTVALTATYHCGLALFGKYVRGDDEAEDRNRRIGLRYMSSMIAEIGISTVIVPLRYLAAVNTQRFLFDFAMPQNSDVLSVVDRFAPSEYMTFALHAFNGEGNQDWNFDFFAWQVPSAALTLVKLWMRRRKLGASNCRTKRVVGVLLLQMFVRAFVSSFSVQLPEGEGDIVIASVGMILESLCTNYLIRHTWPELTL